MCICYGALKVIREASGSDALWMYDPGVGTSAVHAIGPAPSLNSCVALSNVTGYFGAIVDVDGYISTLFSIGAPLGPLTLAAWNGSSTAWFWWGSTAYAYNLSGTLLSTPTIGSPSSGNRYCLACDSSGNLFSISGTSLRKTNTAGTLLVSTFTPNGSTFPNYTDTCCVDSSGNVFVTTNQYIRKYDNSLSTLWTYSLPIQHFLAVTDSAGAVYVLSSNSGYQLRKWNSSGTLQWTISLPYAFSGGYSSDMWCDGTYVYIAYGPSVGAVREKYDASGNLVWSESIWWDPDIGNRVVASIRGNGSLIAMAGNR